LGRSVTRGSCQASWAGASLPRRVHRDATDTARVAGRWETVGRPWVATNAVHLMALGRWFSVRALTDAASGDPLCWYVNFVAALVDAGGPPFDPCWLPWRPDPRWPVARLGSGR